MPFTHGSKAVFKLDDASDVLTDVSAYLTSASMSKSADTVDTTTLQDTNKGYIPGLKDGTISIEGIYDPTVDAILEAALGAQKSFEYGPQGSTTGNVKYTGECICTSYEPSTGVDGAGTFSAELQVTGAVTRGTY